MQYTESKYTKSFLSYKHLFVSHCFSEWPKVAQQTWKQNNLKMPQNRNQLCLIWRSMKTRRIIVYRSFISFLVPDLKQWRENHGKKIEFESRIKWTKNRQWLVHTLSELCAFPVRICIPGEDVHSLWETSRFPVRYISFPGEDMHSRWGTFPFPVRMCIPGETHPHSRWAYALLVRHISIPGEAHPHSRWGFSFPLRMFIVIHPHWEWGCASPWMGMCLTGNEDVPHQECISSLGMEMCLTGNAHPHWEWRCVSPGMAMCLTGNGDVPHREWTSSPGMEMCLIGNGDVPH